MVFTDKEQTLLYQRILKLEAEDARTGVAIQELREITENLDLKIKEAVATAENAEQIAEELKKKIEEKEKQPEPIPEPKKPGWAIFEVLKNLRKK